VGVEHISQLVDRFLESINKGFVVHLLEKGTLPIHLGDGKKDFPNEAH
jgi:hypothetical protein